VRPPPQREASGNRSVALGAIARRPRWLRRHTVMLVVLDALAAAIATFSSRVLSFGVDAPAELTIRSITIPYGLLAVATVPTWLVVVSVARGYDVGPFGTPSREVVKIVRAGATFLAVMAVAYFILHLAQLGREFLVTIVPLAVAFTLVGRLAARLVLRERRRRGHAVRRAVVVGSRARVSGLVRYLSEHRFGGLEAVAACVPNGRDGPAAIDGSIPVIDDLAGLPAALQDTAADSVVVAGSIGQGRMRSLAWSLEGSGVDVLVAPTPADQELIVEARPVAGLPLLYVDVQGVQVDAIAVPVGDQPASASDVSA
jgi:FlaA1/EpsC-like NDP-sugar epimerase